jgi:hypothetical protein
MLPSLVLDKVVKLVEITACNLVMRFERHRAEVSKGQAHPKMRGLHLWCCLIHHGCAMANVDMIIK